MAKVKLRQFRITEDSFSGHRHERTITLIRDSEKFEGDSGYFIVDDQMGAVGNVWYGRVERESRDWFATLIRRAWADERKAKEEGRFHEGVFTLGSFVKDEPDSEPNGA